MNIFTLFKKREIFPVVTEFTHVSVEVPVPTVKEGLAFRMPLIVDEGYVMNEVVVFMGNMKLRGAYKGGVVSISEVSGPIKVVAKAISKDEARPKVRFAPRLNDKF